MKKRFKIIVALLFASLVVFILFNVNALHNEISENQYNRLVNDLGKVTVEFSTWINNKKEMLNTTKDIVNNLSYDEVVKSATDNPYLNVNKDDPDVTEVYIGLDDGGFVTGSDWIPPDDYDPRTRVWYLEAVEQDTTIFSDIYIDRDTGEQTVTISSPLYLEDVFVGVIATDVFLKNINDYLTIILDDVNVYSYLVDQEGTMIVHTRNMDFVGDNLYDSYGSHVIVDYFEEVKETKELVAMRYEVDGEDVMGVIQTIVDVDWYLGVAMMDQSRSMQITSMATSTIIFNVFLLAIIIALLMMVIRMKKSVDDTNEELRLDNEKDFLTGIYNRRYFDFIMDKLWKESEADVRISLLMMDIDFFKNYNDHYGHIKGDEVLKQVANIVQNLIRKEDVFSRYGGEEFTLLLKGVTEEAALSIAEKVRRSIYDANIEHAESPFGRLTISIGAITCKPDNDCDVGYFVSEADQVLYKAKEMGRNVVMVHHEEE